ncbi:MAG: type IX secretion system membrane protein PorP/SprF [Flavobacteriaceae bacterium]
MKFIKIISLLFVFLVSVNSTAQQTPHYTQYMYNMSIINPAYAGARADVSAGLLGRKQWVGIDGAPETQTFSLNVRAFDGIGLGVSVIRDKIGLISSTDFNADISYTVVISSQSRLALGVKGGFTNFTNNLSQGITPDNDVNPDITGIYPNVGMGAFYYNTHFYAGVSVPQLFKTPKYKLDNNQYAAGLNDHMNYFATAGYVFDINEKVKFKPSTLIKIASGLPLSVDINANVLYDNLLEFGLSYRYNDSVSGMIGIQLYDKFRLGYSYDHTLTGLGNFNDGSHEIMLLFDLDLEKRGRWLNDSSCYF